MKKLESAFEESFAGACPAGEADKENVALLGCLKTSRDAVTQSLSDFAVLDQYITLHVPQMEDGNNFGVTVQLAAIKQLKDSVESLEKELDLVSRYCKERADVMDKFMGSSSESTKEETTEGGENAGTKKTTSKDSSSKVNGTESHRKEAVLAIDFQFFTLAKKALMKVIGAYIANLDFILKNKDKIEKPKGNDGGSGFSSMY